VLGVAGTGLLKSRPEITLIEDRLMGGFWAAGDYVGIEKSFIYDEALIATSSLSPKKHGRYITGSSISRRK